jgi:hypothetical protein
MKRLILPVMLGLLISCGVSYGDNEIRSLNFLPRYSVINSSCLGGDSGSLLVNPAGLSYVERMTAELSTTNLEHINFLGMAALLPENTGVAGLDIYNTLSGNTNAKRGLAFGWGKEFLGCLSLGAGVKTVSSYPFDMNDGVLLDAGLIFTPNDSINMDFLHNSFIDNKIFISFAVQNLGKEPVTASPENLNLRAGLAYDFDAVWTKIFVEKMFLSTNAPLYFGAEINPSPDILKLFVLRASYEAVSGETKLGFGLHSDDAMLDISYSVSSNDFFMSFNVYFEKSRKELSADDYNEGLIRYNEAADDEKEGNDSIDKYHESDQKLSAAVSLDRNNRKALALKNQVDSKLMDYKAHALTNARSAEDKKDPVTAIIYYNKAAKIDSSPDIMQKVKTLMANQAVIAYIINSRIEMRNAVISRKYLTAKKITTKLLLVDPQDSDAQSYQVSINAELKKFAEVYYQKAQSLYDRELYEDCITRARTSLIYDPDLEKTKDLLSLALTDLTEKQSSRKANELYRNQNYLGALKMVNYILSRDPENQEASSLKSKIIEIFKTDEKNYLDEGISNYNNSEFDKSVEDFNIVLLVDPGNNTASDYKTRAETKQKALEKLGEIQEQ